MAASSAADPASRAAAATYESANGQITVTSQVSGFPASQGTRERPSGRLLLLLLLLYDAHIVSVFTLTEARLAGGETEREGRLEVSYNGVWGTVCADDFDDINAAVACHVLGYG